MASVNDNKINFSESIYSEQSSHHLIQYSLPNSYYNNHLHYYSPQTSTSVHNQNLHCLQPRQFYYLHNQSQFYVNAPSQCQHTIQPVTTVLNKNISTNNYSNNNLNNLTVQHKPCHSNINTTQNLYQNYKFYKSNNLISKKNTMNTNYDVDSLRKKKKWQMFPGRNRFCCDGRLMISKQVGVFYFTLSLLLFTCALFFIFDCPFLANNVNQFIPVVGAILFIFSLSTLLKTSFTDPGIIPRANADEIAHTEKEVGKSNSLNSPSYYQSPRIKEVIINNQTVKLKYCITCKIYKPPRASHCSMCDNCVERFDHHCPWVGNCIGKRNYRYFYMFILSLSALCVFVFVSVIIHLVILIQKENFLEAIRKSPASVLEAAICFFSVWSVLALAGFHSYLICINQTTNEDIKLSFNSKKESRIKNPYSKNSFFKNCCVLLCGPNNPSLIDARGYYDPNSFLLPSLSCNDGIYYTKTVNHPYPKQQEVFTQINEQKNLIQNYKENILIPQTSEYQQNHISYNEGTISTISSNMSNSINSDINLNQKKNLNHLKTFPISQHHIHHHNHQIQQVNHQFDSNVNINNTKNTKNSIPNLNNFISRVENKNIQQNHFDALKNSIVHDEMVTKVNKNELQINVNEKKINNNLIIKQSAV